MKLTIGVIFLILAIVIGPCLIVWAINTIAEQSGTSFYLHHNIWTYLAVLVIAGTIQGGSQSK